MMRTQKLPALCPQPSIRKKEIHLIQENINPDIVKHPGKIETNPLNEYKTEYIATLSFRSLFPDAKVINALVRIISENETEAFS